MLQKLEQRLHEFVAKNTTLILVLDMALMAGMLLRAMVDGDLALAAWNGVCFGFVSGVLMTLRMKHRSREAMIQDLMNEAMRRIATGFMEVHVFGVGPRPHEMDDDKPTRVH